MKDVESGYQKTIDEKMNELQKKENAIREKEDEINDLKFEISNLNTDIETAMWLRDQSNENVEELKSEKHGLEERCSSLEKNLARVNDILARTFIPIVEYASSHMQDPNKRKRLHTLAFHPDKWENSPFMNEVFKRYKS